MSDWTDFRRAVKASELEHLERVVVLAMHDTCGESRTCWVAARTIAGDLALHERSVRRAWKALEEAGWIERAPSIRRTITWALLAPVRADSVAPSGRTVRLERTHSPLRPGTQSYDYKEDKERESADSVAPSGRTVRSSVAKQELAKLRELVAGARS